MLATSEHDGIDAISPMTTLQVASGKLKPSNKTSRKGSKLKQQSASDAAKHGVTVLELTVRWPAAKRSAKG